MPKSAKIPAVRFNLKSRKELDIPSLIILIFRYNGNVLKYSTGFKVKPRYWDTYKNRAKSTKAHLDYSDINAELNKLENITINIFKESSFGVISIPDFKKQIDIQSGKVKPEIKENLKPLQFIEQYLEERKAKPNAKRGTWKKLETVYNHLKEFSKESNKKLDWKDFDWSFKNEFENWLFSEPRNHAINNAAKIFQVTKQFLYEATKRGLNNNLTFQEKGWGINRVKVKKIALTFEELLLLSNLDLSNNPRLDRVRDLFLIGAYSGLRYSDFTRIKPEHIIEDEGVEMIEIDTKKTDTEVVIPLMPQLKAILEKYNYRSPKGISAQKMNDYLKELCEKAGIDKEVMYKFSKGGLIDEKTKPKYELVTTHTARRSFATNFYELGIPAAHLMLITGHATEKQFMGYINMDKRTNAKNIARQVAILMGNSPLKVAK